MTRSTLWCGGPGFLMGMIGVMAAVALSLPCAFAFGVSEKAIPKDSGVPVVGPLVWVAAPDGGVQCDPESGKGLDQAAAELKALGISVLDRRKLSDGKMRAQMCGMPSGMLNAFQISSEDLSRLQAAKTNFEVKSVP